jgi:hypothetical protein
METDLHKAGALPPIASSGSSTPLYNRSRSSTLFARIAKFVLALGLYASYRTYVMSSAGVDLSRYTESVFIPFIFKFSTEHVPQVMCTIEGVDIEMPVDTGSTGTLIGAPMLPNIDPSTGEPAHHFFTSSRILYVGRLVELLINFRDEAGLKATAKVPILIVDKSYRCPWYDPTKDRFDCPVGPNGEKAVQRDTSNITYMGVGFGRNEPRDGMPYAIPGVNAFLNIVSIGGRNVATGSIRSGYIVSTNGVHLGLTTLNTRNFAFEDLQPGLTHKADQRDWAMAQMCVSIDGGAARCGASLIDTGISQMYIRAGEGVSIPTIVVRNPNKHSGTKMVKRVKPGTDIAIGFPSLESPVSSYSFVVGEGSKMEPSHAVPGKAVSPPFINTGRHFLFGHSIAFDAVGGRFGFRPVHTSSSSVL